MAAPGVPGQGGVLAGGNVLNVVPSLPTTIEEIPNILVTFGPVAFDDNAALYANITDSSTYTDYMIDNRFESDKHIYMMGITSPGGFQGSSVAFCQLASPTLLWISDWTACKTDSQPTIPDPISKDPNWILMDEHLEPGMLTLMADGVTPLYRISGTYVYGHRNPSQYLSDNTNFTRPPWMEDAFDRTVPLSAKAQNIINIQGKGGGVGGVVFPGAAGGVAGGIPNAGPGVP